MKLTPLILTAAALTASAQSNFEWKGPIGPDQKLEIRNVIGDIKAVPAAGADVEISVRITGTRPDPGTIRIDVVQHEGGILVCTIYQGLSRPEHCAPGETPSVTLTNTDVRVVYTIGVPAGVSFTPRTVNGNITADLPDSAVSAYTVNGRIALATSRAADAHTVNGSVLATLGSVEWEGTREFGAVNGSVDVEIPESARATVYANTVFGAVSNDFGLTVHRNIVGRWFSGDVNGGGPSLVLGAVNGSIHLRHPVQ